MSKASHSEQEPQQEQPPEQDERSASECSVSPASEAIASVQGLHGNQQFLGALSGEGGVLGETIREAAALGLSGVRADLAVPGTAPLSAMRAVLARHRQSSQDCPDAARAAQLVGKRAGDVLPEGVRARMEQALGHDFRHVRVHTDRAAAEASAAVNARAFTAGTHIYFGEGQWRPEQRQGAELLAHELTHVIQHDEGRLPAATPGAVEVSSPSDPHEREAEAAGQQLDWAFYCRPIAPEAVSPPPQLEPAAAEGSGAPLSRECIAGIDISTGDSCQSIDKTPSKKKQPEPGPAASVGVGTAVKGEVTVNFGPLYGFIYLNIKASFSASTQTTVAGGSGNITTIVISIGGGATLDFGLFSVSLSLTVFGSISRKNAGLIATPKDAKALVSEGASEIVAFYVAQKFGNDKSGPRLAGKLIDLKKDTVVSPLQDYEKVLEGIATGKSDPRLIKVGNQSFIKSGGQLAPLWAEAGRVYLENLEGLADQVYQLVKGLGVTRAEIAGKLGCPVVSSVRQRNSQNTLALMGPLGKLLKTTQHNVETYYYPSKGNTPIVNAGLLKVARAEIAKVSALRKATQKRLGGAAKKISLVGSQNNPNVGFEVGFIGTLGVKMNPSEGASLATSAGMGLRFSDPVGATRFNTTTEKGIVFGQELSWGDKKVSMSYKFGKLTIGVYGPASTASKPTAPATSGPRQQHALKGVADAIRRLGAPPTTKNPADFIQWLSRLKDPMITLLKSSGRPTGRGVELAVGFKQGQPASASVKLLALKKASLNLKKASTHLEAGVYAQLSIKL